MCLPLAGRVSTIKCRQPRHEFEVLGRVTSAPAPVISRTLSFSVASGDRGTGRDRHQAQHDLSVLALRREEWKYGSDYRVNISATTHVKAVAGSVAPLHVLLERLKIVTRQRRHDGARLREICLGCVRDVQTSLYSGPILLNPGMDRAFAVNEPGEPREVCERDIFSLQCAN